MLYECIYCPSIPSGQTDKLGGLWLQPPIMSIRGELSCSVVHPLGSKKWEMNSYNETSVKVSDKIDISKIRPWWPNHLVCTRISDDCNLVIEQLQKEIINMEKGKEQFKVSPNDMHITSLAIGESPEMIHMFRDCELKVQQTCKNEPVPFKLVDLTNFNGNICVRLTGEYLMACQDICKKIMWQQRSQIWLLAIISYHTTRILRIKIQWILVPEINHISDKNLEMTGERQNLWESSSTSEANSFLTVCDLLDSS